MSNPYSRANFSQRNALPNLAADRIRTLLRIRVSRATPPLGSRPHAGARIFCGDLRMTVQAGMSHDLWVWLQRTGWREVRHRPDRRRYFDIPSESVAELIACAPEHRSDCLKEGIARSRLEAPAESS